SMGVVDPGKMPRPSHELAHHAWDTNQFGLFVVAMRLMRGPRTKRINVHEYRRKRELSRVSFDNDNQVGKVLAPELNLKSLLIGSPGVNNGPEYEPPSRRNCQEVEGEG